MITRRSFLEQAALIGLGAVISPACVLAKPFNNIGIQLYTLRDEIVKDVRGVIAKVAKSGYQDVETYDFSPEVRKYWGIDAKSFKKLLDDNGLISTSGHYDFRQFMNTGKTDDLKAFAEAANIVGQKNIVMPSLSPEWRTSADQYKQLAEKMNKASEICRKEDVNFCFHNHDYEFEKLSDGITGYDILLQNTNSDFKFEMDIYWVVKAGYNPITFFEMYPGRFYMWHVKDMSKQDKSLETEIGKGTINFKEIFSKAKLAGTELIFVEQENNYYPDVFSSIKESAGYVKRQLL